MKTYSQEQRSITYNGVDIPFTVTIKSVKRLNLRVKPDGSIHVSVPPRFPLYRVDAFVIEHMAFIERVRSQYGKWKPVPKLDYNDGDILLILDRQVTIVVEPLVGKGQAVYDGNKYLYLHVGVMEQAGKEKVMQTFWRNLGHRVFHHWAGVVYERFHQAGYDVPMPVIKQQVMKSRWGSCTPSKRTIKMNTRLLEGPESFIEYVMIHEFAHFIYLDHSPRFHQVVAQFLPDWKERKHQLNQYFSQKQ